MKFAIFEQHGAINSKPVFEAFIKGCRRLDIEHTVNPRDQNYDVAVIWSVLWQGRMRPNREIWDHCQRTNKKVVVLEVGGFRRNHMWRIGIGGINREADFANDFDIGDRYKKIGLELKPWMGNRGNNILICTQNPNSYQWRNMPPMSVWLKNTIQDIREFYQNKIIIRPHPRAHNNIPVFKDNVEVVRPKRIPDTYDDVDIDTALDDVKFVVNHCTNPGIEAVLNGIPAMTGDTSLAWPVSMMNGYMNFSEPDRENWVKRLAYIEWTTEEIEQGEPISRLMRKL
jgi:hypothetical protein